MRVPFQLFSLWTIEHSYIWTVYVVQSASNVMRMISEEESIEHSPCGRHRTVETEGERGVERDRGWGERVQGEGLVVSKFCFFFFNYLGGAFNLELIWAFPGSSSPVIYCSCSSFWIPSWCQLKLVNFSMRPTSSEAGIRCSFNSDNSWTHSESMFPSSYTEKKAGVCTIYVIS